MSRFFRELFCRHAYFCGDRDYSECLKCGKWRDYEWDNERGRREYDRLRKQGFIREQIYNMAREIRRRDKVPS